MDERNTVPSCIDFFVQFIVHTIAENIPETGICFDPKKYSDDSELCRDESVLDVIVFKTDNNYSRGFKLELLKRFLDVCDFHLNMFPDPHKRLSIYDFFVPNEMVESGMFCLFQAGASTEFIRYFSREFQKRTRYQYRSQLIYSNYPYNTKLCRALVSDRDNTNFLTICLNRNSVEMNTIRSQYEQTYHGNWLHESPVFEQLIEELHEWYRHVTSSPRILQSECRTLIRKNLIVASGHWSILKRIELLHIPEKLKKFLIYD